MVRILLACCGGMSSSILVNKIVVAAEKRHIECNVFAIAESLIPERINEADVVLIGPQVRYMLTKIKQVCDEHNVVVDVIPMQIYGLMDGEKALDFALDLLKK